MQVTVHSIDRTTVIDFTDATNRSPETPPFVQIQLIDGKSSVIDLLLHDESDVAKLVEAATSAYGMFYRLREQARYSV